MFRDILRPALVIGEFEVDQVLDGTAERLGLHRSLASLGALFIPSVDDFD